jgi:dTDP-4-amino-4,6-dideoxygalactose transaminase
MTVKHQLWPIVEDEEKKAVLEVLDRGVLSGSNGPAARAFESAFARCVGAKYALMTHSGTSALQVALAAAGVEAGDEVIIPAYSFVATAMAPLLRGAIPIFVDVRPETGNLDPALLSEALSERTKAIMPVHVHGCPADLGAILDFARTHDLVVVEDAAQAHLATYDGSPVGALGAAGGFSLQSSKNLGCGEGGVFVTNDDEAYAHANRIRNFGQNVTVSSAPLDLSHPLDGSPLVSSFVGSMYRGNEMTAAFASAQLAKLPARTKACQDNAAWLSSRLAELDGVLPPTIPEGRTSVHHKFRVRFDLAAAGVEDVSPVAFRDSLVQALREEGLEVVYWQTEILPGHPLFSERLARGQGWPIAEPLLPRLADNYDPARYPVARALLSESLVLFSQSCPLIAQTRETVEHYAKALSAVWAARQQVAERARKG